MSLLDLVAKLLQAGEQRGTALREEDGCLLRLAAAALQVSHWTFEIGSESILLGHLFLAWGIIINRGKDGCICPVSSRFWRGVGVYVCVCVCVCMRTHMCVCAHMLPPEWKKSPKKIKQKRKSGKSRNCCRLGVWASRAWFNDDAGQNWNTSRVNMCQPDG